MPSSPKQPCARPGCSNLVSRGYCASCSEQGHGKDTRQSANQRGYNYRWQKASKAFLQQNPIAIDYYNEFNGRIYLAEVVDHIIPHKGDPEKFWDPSNWAPMTRAQHNRKTSEEDGGFGHAIKPNKRAG